ncbi:MAG: protein-L-isoaspartate(D-aspartate) O-methyltransferase [Rhodospirillales bacterium]
MADDPFAVLREQMVQVIAIYAHYSGDKLGKETFAPQVMAAMRAIPRHEFVPLELRAYAYADGPLPIGYEKTISQPYMVALMTDLADIGDGASVLEVGTGLGYHAAIMATLGAKVYSVEIVDELASQAKHNLARLGFKGIRLRTGDGSHGWAEHGPFDRIMVCAAPELIPPSLIAQLKPGGKMVVPAGMPDSQQLMVVEKDLNARLKSREIIPVRFSPLETVN